MYFHIVHLDQEQQESEQQKLSSFWGYLYKLYFFLKKKRYKFERECTESYSNTEANSSMNKLFQIFIIIFSKSKYSILFYCKN